PPVDRDGIILPAGTLDRIERQTVRFSELREELARMGRHMKRGILLYGPPGTGKTLTAMYLASRMPDRTVLLLTGRTLGLIEQAIEIPLPDEACRTRLLELYGRGLELELSDPTRIVAQINGVSAAFIRELLRRAALFAADEGERTVGDRHLDVALQELAV